MAVHAAALGCDYAGRRAEHGIPEPKGKQRGCRPIPGLPASESLKRLAHANGEQGIRSAKPFGIGWKECEMR